MTEKVAIISVDGHVKPPRGSVRDYLDPGFRDRFDESLRAAEGTPDGFVHPALGEAAQWDASQRLSDMETQGVVAEVLFSNGKPFEDARADHAADADMVRASDMAYNRWLLDFCSVEPRRLLGLAAVAFDDIDQAVADIGWAKDQGFAGIEMPPLHPGGRYFFDPELDPIWAACAEAGLPLCQHGGTGAPEYAPRSFASFMVLATEHWFFSGRSLWQLILGGVFERFPDLRLALIETEQWWIGPIMDLLDGRETQGDDWSDFAEMLGRLKPYKRLPSEYWATNCYAGLSPFNPDQMRLDQPPGTGFTIEPDRAMVGVDYPHPETVFPGLLRAVKRFAEHPNVDEADVRKALYGNAAGLFDVDLTDLTPVIDRIGFDLDDVPEPPPSEGQASSLFDVVSTVIDNG
ncbi:MAG: amidohydrolase family protein [Acidimicrobiia bacterium]|nr:amidohydrolase family protein [Acidimicrobiia bacterium]